MRDLVAVATLERRILDIVGPVVEEMGFELVRLRFGGGKSKTLQIMAERSGGGMELDDCAEISRAISSALDINDPIEGKYNLEVSSPGIDRPLTRISDFRKWTGHLAKIETSRLVDGRRRFKGVLRGVTGNRIDFDTENGAVQLEFNSLAAARLVLTDALMKAAAENGECAEAQPATENSQAKT